MRLLEMSHRQVNLSEEEIDDKIEEFQDWILDQPNLPQNFGKVRHSSARHLKNDFR